MAGRRAWYLYGLWFCFTGLWCGGVFWGGFAAALHWVGDQRPWRLLWLASLLWPLGVEWLRTQVAWGFHWTLLGNLAADFPWLRQLAALGGVWLLSALIVMANVAIYVLLFRRHAPRFWITPAITAAVIAVAVAGGFAHVRALEDIEPQFDVAALQLSQDSYSQFDYTAFGMDKHYLRLTKQAYERFPGRFDMLVLPESIGFGGVSLDGTRSEALPGKPVSTIEQWMTALTPLLPDPNSILVFGIDTVEQGRDRNSALVMDNTGPVGWYHKRGLVPFAEYQPRLTGLVDLSGASQFHAGVDATPIAVGGLKLGLFICQEILFPELIRESTSSGATLLVSVGNDGVFSDPAVALVHAKLAQVRATETGRYLVRSMKTGVSAIVSPSGKVLAQIPSDKVGMIVFKVAPLEHMTPYVRFGDWPLILFGLGLGVFVLRRPRDLPFGATVGR